MKIILSAMMLNNGNLGCVALALSSMYIIKDILEKHGETAEFFLPGSGQRMPGAYTYRAGHLELPYTAIPDISCHNKELLLHTALKPGRTLQTARIYKQARAQFDIGQGDSFADIYGRRRFESIYGQYRLAMRYGVPLCVMPQTIGPYSDPAVRKRAVKGLSYAGSLMTRDRQSLDYLHEILPGREAKEVIDVAFFMPYEREQLSAECVHVGINVSALLWHGGYTMDNQFGLRADYKQVVRSIIGMFLKMPRVKVHLVPHVVGGERGVENDYAVAYDLWREYSSPDLLLPPLFLDPILAKSYIAGLDFFMGARMHSTIAAFSTGVPVVPMAYSRKFNGLFLDTLQYPHLVDLKQHDVAEALDVIGDAFTERASLKQLIEGRMATTVRERERLMREEIERFLGV